MNRTLFLTAALFVAASSFSFAQLTYDDWAKSNQLFGGEADPKANPDGDRFVNGLEYTLGTDPTAPDNASLVSPGLEVEGKKANFVYRVGKSSRNQVDLRVLQSTDLKNWRPVAGVPQVVEESADHVTLSVPVSGTREVFYVLEARVRSTVFAEAGETVFLIGSNVGQAWDWDTSAGPLPASDVYIHLVAPATGVDPNDPTKLVPNSSKYPTTAGASLGAFTQWLKEDYEAKTPTQRPPLRSWMGWFLWGNGTPPDGINPGIFKTAEEYGSMTPGTPWDYFSWQYQSLATIDSGSWNPIRVDQQPLYLNPLTLSYNWAPGIFGYRSEPFNPLPETQFYFYWRERQIVRGVNLSGTIPFLYQYGDKLTPPAPAAWQELWLKLRSSPLETTVVVPGNVPPMDLLKPGEYNKLPDGTNDPFPYPVWDKTRPASDQTPFALLVDSIGDFHTDLIWEAANPRATEYYNQNRYRRPGTGNYMKMTVARGSPFVWCETSNAAYANFYNLIRTNLVGQIDNNALTDAKVLLDGPYDVPGVKGVKYVLLYGNQVNPNQWYQETQPQFPNLGTGPDNDQSPGGFNPAPAPYRTKSNATITPKGQSNHIYTAVFYRDSAVKPVQLGTFGKNAGYDGQGASTAPPPSGAKKGNPYFYLEFINPEKNWFVVGSVPEMRYYHTGITPDSESARIAAAKAWANEMGKYAFNFVTSTKIDYSVTNMYQTTTNYRFTLANPYVTAKAPNAAGMTVPGQTVLALNPHQYQPITLGPDLTKASRPSVVWSPLQKGYGTDFPKAAAAALIPQANKSTPSSPSLWEYWTLRGNLKTIVTSGFSTVYPFQNFLPTLPPPDYDRKIKQTGVAGLNITNVGTGNTNTYPKVEASIRAGTPGSGAKFSVIIGPDGTVQQVLVDDPGSGYPVTPPSGDPSNTIVPIDIAKPASYKEDGTGGQQAFGYVQTGGGRILKVVLSSRGSGYSPVIEVTQGGRTTDTPVIIPSFDPSGNLIQGPTNTLFSGAGFDFAANPAPTFNFLGNGTPIQAEFIRPGNLISIGVAPVGGASSPGTYPSTGSAPTLTALLPPPNASTPAQTATVQTQKIVNGWQAFISNVGNYESKPTASIVDADGHTVEIPVAYDPGTKGVAVLPYTPANINVPTPVTFSGGGTSSAAAVARLYPTYQVSSITLANPLVGGYNAPVQLTLVGGVLPGEDGVVVPEIDFSIASNGTIPSNNVTIKSAGEGLNFPFTFEIAGGRGFDAYLQPILSAQGEILAVKVLSGGSNYLDGSLLTIFVVQPGGASGTGAEFEIQVTNGVITAVTIPPGKGGEGYKEGTVLKLLTKLPAFTTPSDVALNVSNNPKGRPARFQVNVANGKATSLTREAPDFPEQPQMRYFPGSENKSLITTGPSFLAWQTQLTGFFPFAAPVSAYGYVANPAPVETEVGQVLYSSIINQYTSFASKALAPFGGAFLGNSAPDAYGLGSGLGAATTFAADVFNLYQSAGNTPGYVPSAYAVSQGTTLPSAYINPAFQANNPIVSLGGALRGTVQGLQQSMSQLFLNPPSKNSPIAGSPNTWDEDYFVLYDDGVGRMTLSPTATQPVYGVISSVANPSVISETENADKAGLSQWRPGMMWTGFFNSDQWNDAHYFYGYYLTTAALAAIFDGAWLDPVVKPTNLWADPAQMGTAIDQLLLSLVYDPDNPALNQAVYTNSRFKYQRLPFFDQWSGHAWATGAQPGPGGAVKDFASDPIGYWLSMGTTNAKAWDENENSIFEGIQAWSAAILWGGATDRKAVVDQGIYLYSTSLAAADSYFLDKNSNLVNAPQNKFSWVPVTTIDSSLVPINGNNAGWKENTSYSTAQPEAFYIAPQAFGDGEGTVSSPGQSLLRKAESTTDTFFSAYPVGPRLIQAFPPRPWTLGIARNSNFMRKWAGALMRQEWKDLFNTGAISDGDFNALALTAALSGVPYNPGDTPFPLTNSQPAPLNPVRTLPERLWSSWVTPTAAPGASFAPKPMFTQTSILAYLLSLDTYGTPDWTYIGRATNASGRDDNNAIVFTASFSKVISPTQVQTTFVAFNPGWAPRYAIFQRLNPDGTINTTPVSGAKPLTLPAKKLVTVKQIFDVK